MAGEYEDVACAVQAGNLLAKRLSKSYLIGANVDLSQRTLRMRLGFISGYMDLIVNQAGIALTVRRNLVLGALQCPAQANRCRLDLAQ